MPDGGEKAVRCAVIGCGNIGSFHALNIASGKIQGMTLCALCDTDEAARSHMAALYPEVPVFAGHQELLEKSGANAVIVAVPHYAHPAIAEDAFRAGCSVLCEKPVGVRPNDVKRMMNAAEQSGKVFAIMFNQRTDPLFARARELVRSGEIGVPKRLIWNVTNWYRTQSYYDSGSWRASWAGEGGGVLMNQAPHQLDLLQWIFGMPERVTSFCTAGKYHDIEVEDDAVLHFEYANGASAEFITSTGECPGSNRLEISGDLGKLVLEDGVLKRWRLLEHEREFCFSSKVGFYQPEYEYSEFKAESPEGHIVVLQNFCDAILHGTPLISPGYDGINELSLANAAYLSWWCGKTVQIPCDAAEYESELEKRCLTSRYQQQSKRTAPAEIHPERWSVRW